MESQQNKTVGALLEKMVSSDTDYRFMGINDLINELQTDSLRLDAQSEKKVVSLVLHLLKDPNGEVQGLAVKALGPLATKVKDQLLSAMVKDLVVTLEKGGDEKLRGVCSIGLKTVINALPASTDVRVLLNDCLVMLMQMAISHVDPNVRLEACEVLGELINHLGNRLTMHHVELLECMLYNLSSPQNTVRKRVTQALGGLAWIISQDLLASLFVYLITRLRNAKLFSGKALLDDQVSGLVAEHPLLQRPSLLEQLRQPPTNEMLKTMLQCLNTVSRHILRVPQQIPAVLQLLAWILQQPGSSDSMDMDDAHELAIQTLATLIRCCPRNILPNLPELINVLCERLQYDPNYDCSVGEEEMALDNSDTEGEDDDADYTDDEDYSWKVRRASARALEAVILTFPDKTADFYLTVVPLLIKRFNDHEEPVRLNIFSCFATLLRQTRIAASTGSAALVNHSRTLDPQSQQQYQHLTPTSLHGRTSLSECAISQAHISELAALLKDPDSAQSRLMSMLPSVCRSIHQQATAPPKRKSHLVTGRGAPGIQHSAFMLYRDLALALPGYLGDYLNDIFSLVKTYSQDSSTNNTVKIDMINLVVLLLGTHESASFKPYLSLIVQLALWAMQDSFYRVALEGLELTQLLSCHLRKLGQEGQAQTLFTPLYNLLDANDRDLELKEKAVTSAAVFINQLGDLIGNHLEQCLEVIYRRLTNELTRLTSVRAIHIISISPFALNTRCFLPKASDELATFLNKNDRLLRSATLRCLYTIWSNHPSLVGRRCLETVLGVLPKLLTSEQDQLATHLISLLLECSNAGNRELDASVTQFITSSAFVQPIIGLAHSPLLRGQALAAMLRLMRAISRRALRKGEEQQGILTLFLSNLLEPLNGSGLLVVSSSNASASGVTLHRDALPSLAQCVAELLAELPITSIASNTPASVPSVNIAIDRLINAVKRCDSSVTQVYLNLLILGELGRKIDLSSREDLREIFISSLSVTPVQTSVKPSGAVPTNGISVIEEVRPAAALGLGRLVIGHPHSLLPFLVARISEVASAQPTSIQGDPSNVGRRYQLYHMLQSLREVLVHLAGYSTNDLLRKHLDDIWSLLMASSGFTEEGTRLVVAECLGCLVLVSPREILNRLRMQLTSSECPLVRHTLLTAVRSILIATDLDANAQSNFWTGQTRVDSFDWANIGVTPSNLLASVSSFKSNDSDDLERAARTAILAEVDSIFQMEQPPPLLDFLSRLADPDILVRRAALVALNTAAHHRPVLIRPLLNMPIELSGHVTTLLKLLYTETDIRPELIREVEMGPFKRKEDDGLDLRKCAFECMFTLLENCLDKLVIVDFLDPLIKGLKDHTDIQLVCYQMLQQATFLRPLDVAAKMEALSVPLKAVLLSKPKDDWVKQELEKQQELSRAAVATVFRFKSIENIDKNRSYLDLLHTIENEPSLKSVYTAIAAQDPLVNFARKGRTIGTFAYNA